MNCFVFFKYVVVFSFFLFYMRRVKCRCRLVVFGRRYKKGDCVVYFFNRMFFN